MMAVMDDIRAALMARLDDFDIRGFISRRGHIFPLGTDTKVLSTVFELVSRPMIVACANAHDYDVVEPMAQNHYPDFTLLPRSGVKAHIAIDVKTTYRRTINGKFFYTLGGYTSFIREPTPNKNIVHPFSHYKEHWVLGFVYTRAADRKAALARTYHSGELNDIVSPYKDVDVFVQEKWRIAGESAGSGNTTNIGSMAGTIDDFRQGAGPFHDEAEFLAYWRGYGRTAAQRAGYKNLSEFRNREQTSGSRR